MPQGYINGPIFFNLHTNDFNSFTKNLNIIHLTDDSTLYAKGKSQSDLAAKINTELHKAVKWLQMNRLSLNVSKSFFTVFSSVCQANSPALSINVIN